ncbi:hypothetical protein JCM11641_007476 [Rhodosporidiobolus odoratus]
MVNTTQSNEGLRTSFEEASEEQNRAMSREELAREEVGAGQEGRDDETYHRDDHETGSDPADAAWTDEDEVAHISAAPRLRRTLNEDLDEFSDNDVFPMAGPGGLRSLFGMATVDGIPLAIRVKEYKLPKLEQREQKRAQRLNGLNGH